MLYALGVILFLLGVVASIALHEIGHMAPAKAFGMKVTQYFVGFGPTLFSRKRGETEYGVKAILLGGYVKIVGMLPPEPGSDKVRETNTGLFTQMVTDAREAEFQLVTEEDQGRLFYQKPWWQKVTVMSGGPAMNIAIAAVLYAILIMAIGIPTPTTTVASVADCAISDAEAGRACEPSDPIAPAKAAGLKPGDTFISFNSVPAQDWETVTEEIRRNGDAVATIVIERDGQQITLSTETAVLARTSVDDPEQIVNVGFLGVTPEFVREPGSVVDVGRTMGELSKQVAIAIWNLPERMVAVVQAAMGAERENDGPVSIVGASRVAGELTAEPEQSSLDRTINLLALLAALNMFLALFNLIPLLPLDGGHIAGALYEAVRRGIAKLFSRPDPGYVDVAKMLPVAYGVALVLMMMSVILIYADIVNPVRVL